MPTQLAMRSSARLWCALIGAFLLANSPPTRGDDHKHSREADPALPEPAPASEPDPDGRGGPPLASVRITGTALTPRDGTVQQGVNSSGGCSHVASGNSTAVWNHRAPLPHGAIVNTLRLYYNDTSATNGTAWFTVYDLFGAIVQEWSVSTVGNSGNGFNDTLAIDHEVDYTLYSYLINWRPQVTGTSLQLCGFRVFYIDPVIFRNGFELGGR